MRTLIKLGMICNTPVGAAVSCDSKGIAANSRSYEMANKDTEYPPSPV
jgi:hypothetical protein